MKLLLFLLLMVPASVFSQIIKDSYGSKGNVIGQVIEKTKLVSKLTWEVSGTDTIYLFTFANVKGHQFTDHQAIVLVGARAVDKFYQAVKSVFSEENKKNRDYKLDWNDGGVAIKIGHGEPKNTVMVGLENGYCFLTEKQVDKTFGKSTN